MPDGYLVTAETIRKLRRDHEELRTQLKVLQNSFLRRPATAVGGTSETLAIARVESEIAGYSTNADGNAVLASGVADVHQLRENGELVSLERAVTVWNAETGDIAANTYVGIQRHFQTGRWVVDQVGGAGTTLHRVKLKESMGISSSLQASADLYSLAGVDTGTDITVLDPDNLFPAALGPRTSPDDPLVTLPGAAGLVIETGGSYYAMEMEQAAKWIKFVVLNSTSFTTTDTAVECFPHRYWDGQQPGATTDDSESGFYVYNFETKQTAAAGTDHLFEGGEGSLGYAVWDDRKTTTTSGAEVSHPGLYRIVQMEFECPE